MANHIASISSSSRAIRQHEALETSQRDEPTSSAATGTRDGEPTDSSENLERSRRMSELARMAVMSLSDDDFEDSLASRHSTRTQSRRSSKGTAKPDLLSSQLGQLDSISDIDANCYIPDLQHGQMLSRIEEKWQEIANNLDATMDHLQECSQQVTESSSNCLSALMDSVGKTCDNVDEEVKAFYHLMTKCDELTTKLSIATSFRDEVKTLRKSIETLEQLYKNRPQTATTSRALPPHRI